MYRGKGKCYFVIIYYILLCYSILPYIILYYSILYYKTLANATWSPARYTQTLKRMPGVTVLPENRKCKQGIEHADSERGLKAADKRAHSYSALLHQPTHPQASSALPAAGTRLPIVGRPVEQHKTLLLNINCDLNLFHYQVLQPSSSKTTPCQPLPYYITL